MTVLVPTIGRGVPGARMVVEMCARVARTNGEIVVMCAEMLATGVVLPLIPLRIVCSKQDSSQDLGDLVYCFESLVEI
jgi:uncharacterized protein YbbK (DUF523 family)